MRRPGKAQARPERTEPNEAHEQLKADVKDESGRPHLQSGNAFMIAGEPTLDTGDRELLLRALDLLDRHASDGLANKQQPELIAMRSRILLVRAKLQQQAAHEGTAATQLQTLKNDIARAVKQLNVAYEDLGQVDAFMFVCMQALQTKSGDDVCPCVSAVLSVAYDKLVLDVNQNIREAIEALDQDGGQ